MPILGVFGLAGSVLFGIESTGNAETLAWIGAALIVLAIVASVVIVEPINAKFCRVPGQLPEDVNPLRTSWSRFHSPAARSWSSGIRLSGGRSSRVS